MSVCNSCNVLLPNGEALKLHYRSDYHAFNLDRRANDRPSVKYRDYTAQKAADAEAAAAAAAASAPAIFICDACSKSFVSEGQFEAHMKSKKHVVRVKEILAAQKSGSASGAASSEAGPEGADDEEDSELPAEELIVDHRHCVFCFHESADVDANLDHMRLTHSFYPPDLEWLTDKEGYVVYLLDKVIGGRCLWCEGPKTYESPLATQQHMAHKSHCRVRYEDEAELEEFSAFYEYPPEDDEEALALRDPSASVTSGWDLNLGGGRVARHRELVKYYQRHYDVSDARASVAMGRAAAHQRVLTAAGMELPPPGSSSSSTAVRVAQAVALGTGTRGNRVDKRAQRRDGDYWSHLQLHTGIQMNDIRRKHFVLQTAGLA